LRKFNVRMRSSLRGEHISGAERIVDEERLEEAVVSLFKRAMTHSRGKPDFVNIKVELLKEPPVFVESLPVFEVYGKAEEVLKKIFNFSGIGEELGIKVYHLLLRGPSPSGKVMRGAMIVEVPTGKRLEPDKERGVRITCFDMEEQAIKELKHLAGESYTENLKDALSLSTKTLLSEDVIAELCVSDDPEYTTGYVALKCGYFRIFNIKEKGVPFGGRAIFVRTGTDVEKLINFFKEKPVICKKISGFRKIHSSELESVLCS